MDSSDAIAVIRDCIEADRYRLFRHFTQRMDGRGLFWPDVLAIIDIPDKVRADGYDDEGQDRWIVRGVATDGLAGELVCVMDQNEQGEQVLFITMYFED